MKISRNTLKAFAIVAMNLAIQPLSAFAEGTLKATDPTPALQDQQQVLSPLPQERLLELAGSARQYEFKAQYGLLDHASQYGRHFELDSQRDGIIQEIALYQADGRLKLIKSRIEEEAPHSVAAKSALFLGTAYLIYNGKLLTTRLTPDTELSGSTKISEGRGCISLTRKNLSSLGIDSGIAYQMDSTSNSILNATVSKEIWPHVVASLGQRRSLASTTATPTESTGQIHFGASF